MATSKKVSDAPADSTPDTKEERSVRDINFDDARETSRINHENDVKQNSVGGYEGVEVREAKPVEVINPVRNPATGELETDTRTVKKTPEEVITSADTSAEDK